MRITKENIAPSRADAVRINRTEKMAMIVLAYAATIMDDLQTELADRLTMIENGPERMKELSEKTDAVLNEIRLTIPENQRLGLQNTAMDYEIRLTPKMTPSKTSVVMQKDEFKDLVDHARVKCIDCMESDEDCEKCKLFQLLTVIIPLEDYSGGMLCPYNMGEWAN